MIQAIAVKSTPAQAVKDALEVLQAVGGASMRMHDFVAAMQERGVTVSAAQDVLRMLAGRGLVTFTAVGDVTLAADSSTV